MLKKTLIAASFATVLLAACGGGGDDDSTPAPTAQVPASASESVTGFIAYLKALVVADADTLEPVNVSVVNPPSDESAAPATID